MKIKTRRDAENKLKQKITQMFDLVDGLPGVVHRTAVTQVQVTEGEGGTSQGTARGRGHRQAHRRDHPTTCKEKIFDYYNKIFGVVPLFLKGQSNKTMF